MNKHVKTLLITMAAVMGMVMLLTGCGNPAAVSPDLTPGRRDPINVSGLTSLSSVQFAAEMKCGWNLGNTFDANSTGDKKNKGLSSETSWGMPVTTKNMITTVSNKGFRTIRIPVAWHNHIVEGSSSYEIDSAWMDRVETVVKWALENDMFVILNIHHDNLSSADMSTTWGFSVNSNTAEQATSKEYITKVWEQISARFKNYDHRLVFELLNEPRDMDLPNAFNPTTEEETKCNAIIKEYEQVALNVVRASGGNNATRFVMVPYYAASPWKKSGWDLPTDSASDKLLISTHAYDPYSFAMDNGTNNNDFSEAVEGAELKTLFDSLNDNWVSKGRGVVMGEGSCSDKGNTADRLAWFKSYVSKARAISCPLILWDNMSTISTGGSDPSERHGYFNRNTLSWYFPTLVEAMISTAGSAASNGSPAGGSGSGDSSYRAIWTGSKDLQHWDGAYGITLNASSFSSATASSKIQFTITIGAECTAEDCTNNYSTIHPITAWSDGNINFPEKNDQKQLAVSPGSSDSTVTISPDSASWATIKSKGLIIYGHKVIIKKIEVN